METSKEPLFAHSSLLTFSTNYNTNDSPRSTFLAERPNFSLGIVLTERVGLNNFIFITVVFIIESRKQVGLYYSNGIVKLRWSARKNEIRQNIIVDSVRIMIHVPDCCDLENK